MSQRIGGVKRLLRSSWSLRHGMNLWPPLLFSGIRIQEMSPDFRFVRIRLSHHPFTTNYFGALYGGSLFSMFDPFWALMVLRNLGDGYAVWDRRGEIEFKSPGRTAVSVELRLDPDVIDEIRAAANDGSRVLQWFPARIFDKNGTLIAEGRKQLHIRKKLGRKKPEHTKT